VTLESASCLLFFLCQGASATGFQVLSRSMRPYEQGIRACMIYLLSYVICGRLVLGLIYKQFPDPISPTKTSDPTLRFRWTVIKGARRIKRFGLEAHASNSFSALEHRRAPSPRNTSALLVATRRAQWGGWRGAALVPPTFALTSGRGRRRRRAQRAHVHRVGPTRRVGPAAAAIRRGRRAGQGSLEPERRPVRRQRRRRA
jgi:hypothetical protein